MILTHPSAQVSPAGRTVVWTDSAHSCPENRRAADSGIHCTRGTAEKRPAHFCPAYPPKQTATSHFSSHPQTGSPTVQATSHGSGKRLKQREMWSGLSRTDIVVASTQKQTHMGHPTLCNGLFWLEDSLDGHVGEFLYLSLWKRLHHVSQFEHFFSATGPRSSKWRLMGEKKRESIKLDD